LQQRSLGRATGARILITLSLGTYFSRWHDETGGAYPFAAHGRYELVFRNECPAVRIEKNTSTTAALQQYCLYYVRVNAEMGTEFYFAAICDVAVDLVTASMELDY